MRSPGFENFKYLKIIFIDKTGLEDAINFRKIEFEIIDGYYYDEGHNENINKIIKHLYLKRFELKKR